MCKCSQSWCGEFMHADSSLIVYIRSGRSLPMYKHTVTCEHLHPLLKVSVSCQAVVTLNHLVILTPGMTKRTFKRTNNFLNCCSWNQDQTIFHLNDFPAQEGYVAAIRSSWLTVNRYLIFFKNTSFQTISSQQTKCHQRGS